MLFVRQNKDFHAIKGNSLYKKAAKAKVCNQHLIFIVIPLNIYGYLKNSENCEDLKYFWNVLCSHQSIAGCAFFFFGKAYIHTYIHINYARNLQSSCRTFEYNVIVLGFS